MKEGQKTTEYWLTKITSLIGLAVMMGWITPDDAHSLRVMVTSPEGIENLNTILTICGAAMVTIPQLGYVISRGIAKFANLKHVEEEPKPKPKRPRKTKQTAPKVETE